MNISEVYKKQQINKGLQEHMLRVAGVAKYICDNSDLFVDKNNVITACLLHDMGNLIKSKLETAPELFEPEGVDFWSEIKYRMIEKYDNDVHGATVAKIKEVCKTPEVVKIVEEASFDDIEKVASSGSMEAKLLEYADMRVGMFGIMPLAERFQDIHDRYVPNRFSKEELLNKQRAAEKIEREIFKLSSIRPSHVSNETVDGPLINDLLEFTVT